MNIFFDSEFTGLVPRSTFISIGMITEKDERFYAEFTDFDESLCDEWIMENVFANLRLDHMQKRHDNTLSIIDNETFVVGDSNFIREILTAWLEDQANQDPDECLQLIGDVAHYDMVLLCNLFGGAKNLPKWVNPAIYDICQDICARTLYDKKKPGQPHNDRVYWYPNTSLMPDAFNISREKLCATLNGRLPKGNLHNALYDAELIKMIYEGQREKTETGNALIGK